MSRKLIAIACIAAVLFTIVVIVTFSVTTLGTPVPLAHTREDSCVIAQNVTLAASALLRAPPRSA